MPRPLPARFSPATHEPSISRASRRAAGVYYTPPEVARMIVELTLAPLLAQPSLRILDPACGAGEFLVAARDVLHNHDAPAVLFGIDIDPVAVAQTRKRLGYRAAKNEQICLGDALADGI